MLVSMGLLSVSVPLPSCWWEFESSEAKDSMSKAFTDVNIWLDKK